MSNPVFDEMRASNLARLIRPIIANPFDGRREWTTQGLGMCRTYLDADKRFRLHMWNNSFRSPGIETSEVHTHPWDFWSLILAGIMQNVRYKQHAANDFLNGDPWDFIDITCGAGGCVKSERQPCVLDPQPIEIYMPGHTYHQFAHEPHRSAYQDGTVTLIDRKVVGDGESARVYMRREDERFASAESRPATEAEVMSFAAASLPMFDQAWSVS